jgi:hypothetical protein
MVDLPRSFSTPLLPIFHIVARATNSEHLAGQGSGPVMGTPQPFSCCRTRGDGRDAMSPAASAFELLAHANDGVVDGQEGDVLIGEPAVEGAANIGRGLGLAREDDGDDP